MKKKGRIMIHSVKKKLAISLLFALSLTIAPSANAVVSETASKAVEGAYKRLDAQWQKIKQCITNRKCSRMQLAVFAAALVGLTALVNTIIMAKKLSPSSVGAGTFGFDPAAEKEARIREALGSYNFEQRRQGTSQITDDASLRTLAGNLMKLDPDNEKPLVYAILDLTDRSKLVDYYKSRFSPEMRINLRTNETSVVGQERFQLDQSWYPIPSFFTYLALIPATKKAAVNTLLQKYNIAPIK